MAAHGRIGFFAGSLSPEQLNAVFSAIPADITFVDAEGLVRYYSEYRIFDRTPECLDQDVLACHGDVSRSGVAALLAEFRDGWRDEASFVAEKDGRAISERYVAVRGQDGEYLGCLEIAQWADELGASD